MRNLIPSSDKSELGNIPFHATFAHSAQRPLKINFGIDRRFYLIVYTVLCLILYSKK